MFTIYFLKKIETILPQGRGVGRIDEVSQRTVEPYFPTALTLSSRDRRYKDDSAARTIFTGFRRGSAAGAGG
jgi:hypothetical protein